MGEFYSCICGGVLAHAESDFPQWCKAIRALCWFENETVLTDLGCNDGAVSPFDLPIPKHGSRRFYYRHNPCAGDKSTDSCFPFHATCWTLLEKSHGRKPIKGEIEALMGIFESIHFHRRSLRWGHNYYIEDLPVDCSTQHDQGDGQENAINTALLSDPLCVSLPEDPAWEQLYHTLLLSVVTHRTTSNSKGFLDLPRELMELIMCSLDFRDVQSLVKTCSTLHMRYGNNPRDLPPSFWKSRFWPHKEMGFAHDICPPRYSWMDLFFTITLDLRRGPSRANLQNRKRIWKLKCELSGLINTVKDPGRHLRGNVITTTGDQLCGFTASVLALQEEAQGCRELKQIYVPFDHSALKSGIHAVKSTYTLISNRKMISCLTFEFNNGDSVSAGYAISGDKYQDNLMFEPGWLPICVDQMGFRPFSLGADLESDEDFISTDKDGPAAARWPLADITGVYVGVDALRIVRICVTSPRQNGFDGILWKSNPPQSSPYMHESDIAALRRWQKGSFNPASILNLRSEEQLIAIVVYSSLGSYAGVHGIRFIYNTGNESLLGSDSELASLTFFLDGKKERLVEVTICRTGSFVCNIQFTTNLSRTSDFFPPLPTHYMEIQRISFTVLKDGYIVGFCGCFPSFFKTISSFGIFSETKAVEIVELSWPVPTAEFSISGPKSRGPETALGGILNLGEYQSYIRLEKGYRYIQASVCKVTSPCRRIGQVTGLIFHPRDDKSYPNLLGQWSGSGEIYYLEEGEQVLGLDFTMMKPLCRQISRPGILQVKDLTLTTSKRTITWDLDIVGFHAQPLSKMEKSYNHRVREAFWLYNAMFDQVQRIYEED